MSKILLTGGRIGLATLVVAAACTVGWVVAGGDVISGSTLLLTRRPLWPTVAPGLNAGTSHRPDGAVLRIDSEPPAARLVLDGNSVGTTPLTASVLPGRHHLKFERTDVLDAEQQIDVPSAGLTLNRALWRREPAIAKLRSAYPGAAIDDADFLSDGRIAMNQRLSNLREVWLLAPGSDRLEPFRPNLEAAALAVSPDGKLVAYLDRAAPPASQDTVGRLSTSPVANRLTQVWIATRETSQPPQLLFQLPLPDDGAGYGSPPVEQLEDVAWAPDGRHLLLTTKFGDSSMLSRSRLLVLDTEAGDSAPLNLITMPAEPVPGSWCWSADGSWVAFLARAANASSGKGLLALVAVRITPDEGQTAVTYVADLGHLDTSGTLPLPVSPAGWEPMTADSAAPARLLYSAPVATPSTTGNLLDLRNLLNLNRPPEPIDGLFLTVPAAPQLLSDDRRRVGTTAGVSGPVWLTPDVGLSAGPVLAVSRSEDGTQLNLNSVDLSTGRTQETGARLSVPTGGRSVPAVRWDAQHGQALVLSRPAGTNAVTVNPIASGGLDVWLVQFSEPSGSES